MVNAWKYQGPIFKKMFSKLDFPKAVSVTMTTNIEKSPSCLRPLHFLFRTLLIFPKDFLKNCLPYSIFRKCLPFTNREFWKRIDVYLFKDLRSNNIWIFFCSCWNILMFSEYCYCCWSCLIWSFVNPFQGRISNIFLTK